jgi:hypothetical protein
MKSYRGVDVYIHIFLTSALLRGEWSPAALSPGKEPPVSIGYEAVWAPEPVWTTQRRENSWPYRDSNSDPLVVQPVARRCTDYATLYLIKCYVMKTYGGV